MSALGEAACSTSNWTDEGASVRNWCGTLSSHKMNKGLVLGRVDRPGFAPSA